MYRTIRKKVAGSVSRVDFPEHYDWNRWLREPESDEYYIDSIPSSVFDTNNISLHPGPPSTKGFTYDLPKTKISKTFKQLNIKKLKSSKIFFSYPNTDLREIKEILTEAEIDFSLSVTDSRKGAIFRISEGKNKKTTGSSAEMLIREFYLLTPGVFNFQMLVPGEKVYLINISPKDNVKVIDLLSNLKTEVINKDLVNSENLMGTLNCPESEEIRFHALPDSPIVSRVEITGLEKILNSVDEQKKLLKKVSFTQLSLVNDLSKIKIPSGVKNKLKILSVKNIRIPSTKVRRGIKITDKILSNEDNISVENVKQKAVEEEILIDEDSISVENVKQKAAEQEVLIDEDSISVEDAKQEAVEQTENIPTRVQEEIPAPTINFTQEEKESLYGFLYNYQRPAADFLSEKKFALLNDELGTGKTLEIIGALNILFKSENISNAIIVCREEDTGWPKRNEVLSNKSLSGWYDHLQNYSPSTSTSIIYDNRKEEWKNPSEIKILTYELFKEACKKKLFSLSDFNKTGCLILDEAEDFQETTLETLPKYLWISSGLPSDELKDTISTITGSDEQPVSFGRTKDELAESLSSRRKQDYWIQMDPDQKLEYEKALEAGREKIYDLVQAGNPFLVQSNVFTLIHQLTQIGNFYGKKESSAKSDLLLHHVRSIQKSEKKVLIYSQYDRQGTQRLEKLFAENGIKYALYQTGISLKEMENAVKSFTRDKSVTVFLAGMKAINSKINLANVSYLIHFDQWWSPATTWQAEERISSFSAKKAGEKLNVYNYFIKNSIDEKIQLKLIEKGLNNKNLFDLLSSEGMYSLITNEDWLEILELIEPKDPVTIQEAKKSYLDYMEKLTPDDFAYKIKALIGRIGYKNVGFKTAVNPNEARLYASALKNSAEIKAAVQCLNMKIVPKKTVKEFTNSLVTHIEKIFVFTTGEFDEKLINNPGDERIILIDKHQTSNFLKMFDLT